MKRALAVLAALACAPPLPGPMARVVSVAPEGTVAPDAVRVEIGFSAPVDGRGLVDGRWLALCRREDLHALARDAELEEGFGPGAPVVPASGSLAEGGRKVVLVPASPLPPGSGFAAVLSRHARSADGRPVLDPAGRARTFALLFDTGPAPDREPPRARWVVPPHGPAPANLAALRLRFGEPVAGDLALGPGAPAARAVRAAADVLGLDLAAPLAPGPLPLDLAAVRDEAGNPAAPPDPLEVSACRSRAAPGLLGPTRASAGELSVRLEAALGGMGRLVAEVQARPGEPACGAAPEAPATALVAGEVGPCPGFDPCAPAAAPCPASVEVRGLCPGAAVRVRLASEDLAANRGPPGAWTEVASLPPRPAPVFTEALADADAPEAGGEYAEVANLGTGGADLAGWVVAKRTASGSHVRCTLAPVAGGPVPPGGHALLVGGAYDGRYPLPPGAALYRCGATAFAGGLANDRAVALALEDPSGQQVSTAGLVEPAPRCAAGAVERVHPAGPDAAANWACPGTRTPGACNRSTPTDECPKRPW